MQSLKSCAQFFLLVFITRCLNIVEVLNILSKLFFLVLKTFNQAEKHQWSCMENEWEKEKEKILNSLLGAGQESIDFSAESEVLLLFQ